MFYTRHENMAHNAACAGSQINAAAELRLDDLLPDRLNPRVVKLRMPKIQAARTTRAKVLWASIYTEAWTGYIRISC